jgi:phosphoglucomutase
MKKSFEKYLWWCSADLPKGLKQELAQLEGQKEEIYDRFCKDIAFGTSGMRGKMGVGTNRMNEVVIAHANRGVADYLISNYENPSIIVSYDTRINSQEYAEKTAWELASKGIDVYLFEEPTPVPVLSFAIRHLGVSAGIMITASHNPKEYNGYKVYDCSGNQIDEELASIIESHMAKRDYFLPDDAFTSTKGSVRPCPKNVKNAYLDALREQVVRWTENDKEMSQALASLNVVYTPLNGTGRDYVAEVFEYLGIKNHFYVKEQWDRDGLFPTCPSPNPENNGAFELALEKYANDKTDLIIATDPDSDRVGVMAKKDGKFCRLTGDDVGILMMDYICHCHMNSIDGKELHGGNVVCKSFASSPFAEDIAQFYGVELINVPTGFKNVAAEMEKMENAGQEDDFLFGFEESLGYIYGNYTRDKDGILGTQMICLMAARLKMQGKSLFDELDELQKQHGYFDSKAFSLSFKNEKDSKKIEHIMEGLFSGKLKTLLGQNFTEDESLRESNVFKATLKSGHQVIVRPSGTELKIKAYIFARGISEEDTKENLEKLTAEIETFMGICQ